MSPRALTGSALGLALGLALAAPAVAQQAPGFRAPAPVVRTLPNGLTVAVFEDDRLPLVQIQFLVPAGSVHEPEGEAGVAGLVFQLLGHGTASRTAAAFDHAVQSLGGSVGGSVSREFTTVHGAFLSGDLEAGLELLSDAVVNPLLGDEPLRALKRPLAAGLSDARLDPALLADEHLWAAVFRGHPYGRPPQGAPRALHALGTAEVRAFHRQRYRPDQVLLAIAGDVTPERAFQAAEAQLGSWGGRARESVLPPPPAPAPGWRVRLVDAPGLGRAQVRLGALGPARADPDHDPLTVAAEALAVGPQPGLRISVTGLRGAGLVSVAASAPVDSVGAAVDRMRAALAAASSSPIADEALAAAKRRLIGGFELQFETRGGTIAQWMAAALYAGAGDRLADPPGRIASVAGEEARAAIARWLGAEGVTLVAVGPAEVLRPQLERFGPVEVVPLAAAIEVVETPSATRSEPTDAQLAQGRTLVERALAAHGGAAKLRGIRESSLEGEVVMTPGPREQTGQVLQLRKDPQRFLFSLTVSVLQSVQVLNGERAWSLSGEGGGVAEDLDSLTVTGLRSAFRSDLAHLLRDAAAPATRAAWRGRERRDDRDTDVIELVDPDGTRRVLFLDTGTQRLVAMEQHEGGHTVRRIYRDLREVGGVLWPHQEERQLDGQPTMLLRWSRVAFNTGLADTRFLKPGERPADAPTRRPRAR